MSNTINIAISMTDTAVLYGCATYALCHLAFTTHKVTAAISRVTEKMDASTDKLATVPDSEPSEDGAHDEAH